MDNSIAVKRKVSFSFNVQSFYRTLKIIGPSDTYPAIQQRLPGFMIKIKKIPENIFGSDWRKGAPVRAF